MDKKIKDRTGYIYGNWRVIEYSHKENTDKGIVHYWLCKNLKTEEVKARSICALYSSQYQKDNPEQFRNYSRRYIKKNPNYNREYYTKNRERMMKQTLDYYYENKDKRLKQMRKYYENNLEKLKEYGRNQQKQWKKDHPNYYIENKEKFKEYSKKHQQKKAKLKLQNTVNKGILSRFISSLFNKEDKKNV